MGNINVLPKEVAELIAAGEVVERPASIVKELLENSIDAGASAVTVELRQGGVGYLRISDNGSGISKDDVPVAFLRHATSKIKLSDDLNFISTLGFRGEALASIAAVSHMELITKTRNADIGTRILLEGGVQKELEEAGCPDGATVIVRDLFYNVPARLKFLRRDTSEASAVASIVEKLAISHPEISFKLVIDHKPRLHTPGDGELLSAIHAVFGAEFSNGLLPVDYGMNGISVKGYISSPESSRVNRSMQHFYVNARYIRSKTCYAALEDGYKNSIMVGKCPYCVLNVSIPFDTVDVNVHPAKTEVRFLNDRAVYEVVYFAVKSALSKDDILKKAAQTVRPTVVPELLSGFHTEKTEQIVLSAETKPEKELAANVLLAPKGAERVYIPAPLFNKPVLEVQSPQSEYKLEQEPVSYQYINTDSLKAPKNLPPQAITFELEQDEAEEVTSAIEKLEQAKEAQEMQRPPFTAVLIGELFRTYVLFESGDVFYLLDKHAAHERILFERLKRSVDLQERQILLKPEIVNVSIEEHEAAFFNEKTLQEIGFSFDDFGTHTILLREVPLALAEAGNVEDMFIDSLRRIQENRREIASEGYENLLHSIACRAAMKAHDFTSMQELTELLHMVYENDEIRHCPHGRPVAIALTRSDIEKRFGRV